ncbi:calcium/sodium antiporter, partial [Candidatus Pelagibacter ubique]|nr:calcium/sodium antiporter [Candidatus Pelagibacter ubique]
KGVLAFAKRFNLSSILVSAVIIGFGTSLAELTVSIEAVLANAPEIAVGNIVGSNTANILLVSAIAAMVSPIFLKDLNINREISVMLLATFLLLFFKYIDFLNIITGSIFLTILVIYIIVSLKKGQNGNVEPPPLPNMSFIKALIYCVVGVILLITGGWLLVSSSIKVAQSFGISEAVIGLTVVAIGTAIPELTTTIIAALKKQNDLIIGNILGSNIFNILGILGVTLLIKPVPVTEEMMNKGIWEMIAATILFVLILKFTKSLNRIIASFMLISYVVYLSYLF